MQVEKTLPIASQEFAGLIEPLFENSARSRVAVAVSGGPDSMALAFCAKRWAGENNYPAPIALIVDHKLRAESTEEAETVKRRLGEIGVETEILSWTHDPVKSRVHVKARQARYDLLVEACQKHGASILLIAHQREDQAETILMRMAKGSGLDGLAGIELSSERDGVRFLRPLLTVPRERLIATCESAGLAYVTDPSNVSEKYARGRLRKVLPLLASEGFTVERLVDLGDRAREAKEALDYYTQALMEKAVVVDPYGVIAIDLADFCSVPEAISGRVLVRCLQAVNSGGYSPERASVVPIVKALRGGDGMPTRTLHGCAISVSSGKAFIMRELSAIADVKEIMPGETVVWDERWSVTLSADHKEALVVKALGEQSHEVTDRLSPALRREVPKGRARRSLPALWRGGELAVIPCFSDALGQAATARLMSIIKS
ncbi:MAG: tRNA lysidine(34) synthetase TilS [Alphaproteobacteria bacterium]|nr:tRNA lysidine(34) synthetase TilS [Alphaproteobacteria bacterium]